MSTVSMSEQEFLTRIGHGQCTPDLMSDALADFLRSRGLHDAARALIHWIDTREEMGVSFDCYAAADPTDAQIALECAAKAFARGEPEIAQAVIEDFMKGAS
jgi:hypothetical protein